MNKRPLGFTSSNMTLSSHRGNESMDVLGGDKASNNESRGEQKKLTLKKSINHTDKTLKKPNQKTIFNGAVSVLIQNRTKVTRNRYILFIYNILHILL